MNVKIEHRNRNGDFLYEETVSCDVYCDRIFQGMIRLLCDLEDMCEEENIELEDNLRFMSLRHRIFDIAGSIKRLPDNLGGD